MGDTQQHRGAHRGKWPQGPRGRSDKKGSSLKRGQDLQDGTSPVRTGKQFQAEELASAKALRHQEA